MPTQGRGKNEEKFLNSKLSTRPSGKKIVLKRLMCGGRKRPRRSSEFSKVLDERSSNTSIRSRKMGLRRHPKGAKSDRNKSGALQPTRRKITKAVEITGGRNKTTKSKRSNENQGERQQNAEPKHPTP